MAAFVGKKEIMQLIAPSGKVYQAGTFSGNPVSVAAGLTTLKILQGKGVSFYEGMASKCQAIVNPLKRLAEESKLKLRIVDIASMFQVFFTASQVCDYKTVKTADSAKFLVYHAELLKKGVFVPPSQFETCFLSNAHSSTDLEKTVETMSSVICQLK